MSRLLLVSNRLPVSVRRSGQKRILVPSSGGLVAGLGPAHARSQAVWIGALEADNASRFKDELAKRRLVPVTLEKGDAERHYEGYSNQVLWPLCHYLLEHVQFNGPDFDAYARVNERFAEVVLQHVRPDDTIWIHDYHLMLLPALLRKRLPHARIGFFFHIPFPSSEVFRILPRKEEILRGLLGANLIGLHTYDYARHLVSTFRRVLAVDFDEGWMRQSDGQCKVGVFALGVDNAGLQARAALPAVSRRVERLRKQVQGRKVILGVDRMDYTKGLPQRLDGYAHFLRQRPEWRERAVLVQLAVPSRASMESYRQLKQQVDRRVGEINGAFQNGPLAPIIYMYRSVPAEELAALYRLADVALVTPIRDGMNLVAKEYVASRLDDSGVLLLSEFAGAAAEMGEAILLNPNDRDSIAQALDAALRMSTDEMARRMQALRRRVGANTVQDWAKRFLDALANFCLPAADLHEAHVWAAELTSQFAGATRRLIALDYDGTLRPLTANLAESGPSPELMQLLTRLCCAPGVELAIISGRDPAALQEWFGHLPMHLIAEHGFHQRWRGETGWCAQESGADADWKDAVRVILEDYTTRAPGSFIEEKPVSMVWHYRKAEHGFGQWLARELGQHLSESFANSALSVLHGNKVVEVRPQGFDKGRALQRLLRRLPQAPEFVLVAGDDRTDEDMFMVAPATAWTVYVGSRSAATHARQRLGSPVEVLNLLGDLLTTGGRVR